MARVKHSERARTRTLSADEIRTLWQALEGLPKTSAALIKILLLTGQRRSEVGSMRWEDLKDDLWTIPAEVNKTKKAQVVPLSEDVRSLLAELPRQGAYVFGRGGRTRFSGFSKLKVTLDAEIERLWSVDHDKPMEAWVFHDLRRTARSLLAASGVRREIAERVLGHTIKGVEGVYDRHAYVDEKRDALNRLAAKIRQMTTPMPENVVPFGRGEVGGLGDSA
jgi:integrase